MNGPNDFTVPLREVIEALERSVREGVEQPASVAFVYQPGAPGYDLPRAAVAVTRVTGVVQKAFKVFRPSQYRLEGNRLVWVTGPPPDGARFEVEYTYRDPPSGLTDFNPGSVAGTLIRAVAREITLLHNQMDEAYRRAFIDEAEGVALDNVVALLGVARNPAQKATGRVTFFRKKASPTTLIIKAGERVADQSGRVFVTTEEGRIPSEKEVVREELRGTRRVRNLIAELVGVWPSGAAEDDANDLTRQDGKTRAKAVVDPDGRTIVAGGDKALPESDLVVKYVARSVTLHAEAVKPGPDGNVNAGAINIMPTPPEGIEGVTNEEPTSGGEEPEADAQLRERAKHALARGGNATLDAIKYAVLDVDGVRGAEVLDHQADDSIPLGEVRVRYHYSGDERIPGRVSEVVERTRAAGVSVRLDQIVAVNVSGTFYLIPDAQVPPGASDKFEAAVKDSVESLAIGAPLAARRLNSLAFSIPGIADVAEAQLKATRSDNGKDVPMSDPLPVARDQMVRPDREHIEAVFLSRLNWAAERLETGKYVVDVQLLDERGSAVRFEDFSLDLNVTARAGLKNEPDQPPQRVASFTHTVRFTGGRTAALHITKEDLTKKDNTGFNPNTHKSEVEFSVAAAAYPGLGKAQKTFSVKPLFEQ